MNITCFASSDCQGRWTSSSAKTVILIIIVLGFSR